MMVMAAKTSTVTIGFTNSKPARARFIRGRRRARVEEQLRAELKPWGLPLHRYRFTLEIWSTPTYQDHHGHWRGWWEHYDLQATFTHHSTGAKIVITSIWIDEDGEILQMGTQYGDLTL